MILKLAWRNIWRNRRRSIIVILSICVGAYAMIFVDSLSLAFFEQMIEQQLGAHIGHIQIQHPNYMDSESVDDRITSVEPIEQVLSQLPFEAHFAPRVEAMGLLSSAVNSSGMFITGVDFNREKEITTISESVIRGSYPSDGNEVLISEKTAKSLDVDVGSKVVAMASDTEGHVGSGLFRVVGIFQTVNSNFDKGYAFISLKEAQKMMALDSAVTNMVVRMPDLGQIDSTKALLQQQLGDKLSVLTYNDLIPSLQMQVEAINQSMGIFMAIIGVAMVFGIINTLLMSVMERINEFGVLQAMGMTGRKLVGMLITEASILGVIGLAFGVLIGLLLNSYFSQHGIYLGAAGESLQMYGMDSTIYPRVRSEAIKMTISIVMTVSILASLYPARKATELKPVEAIRFT